MENQVKKLKGQLNEDELDGFERELNNLIKYTRAQAEKYPSRTDGEMLAKYIVPILQSAAMRLKNPNDFHKWMKKKI
tara:strand:+ start:1781 stop:2011 length:231 start_codon:yes stop_codon:yes gene_type:complete